MYTSKEDFISLRGTVFFKGQEISDFKYSLLKRGDKEKFTKKNTSIGQKTVTSSKNYQSSRSESYSPAHYGYGPEPGYTSSNHHSSHNNFDTPSVHSLDYGGGDGGGAGSSDSWSSDSSSSDSGSCDSGGGDCGGGGD